ncbi:MAG: hypothetical protein DRP50_01370 [Thermotoga sp.]|nr:MAG: hypothetical protein DRP50_01370 [Thermotoga sp.]
MEKLKEKHISRFFSTMNQKKILKELFFKGSMSITDIARELKISTPAVSRNVSKLMKAGLIRKIGWGKSNGGRRPMLLSLESNSRIIIAVQISYMRVEITAYNLIGDKITTNVFSFSDILPFERLWKMIEEKIKRLVDTHKISPDNILGIGIGLPSPVIHPDNKIVFSRFYGWKEQPLPSFVEFGSTKVSTFFENDANLMAFGENYLNPKAKNKIVFYIYFDVGIGMGISINGEILSGARGLAGEIGQIVVGLGENGQKVSLEEVVSQRALFNAKERIPDISSLSLENEEEMLTYLNENADEPGIEGLFDDIADKLGKIVGFISNAIDPHIIIFDGSVVRTCKVLMNKVVDKINFYSWKPTLVELKSNRDEKLVTRGAYAIVLKNLLEFDIGEER